MAPRKFPIDTHVLEALALAYTVSKRTGDQNIVNKATALKACMRLSEKYPTSDCRPIVEKALAELTALVHQHLNKDHDMK
jgi:hypothetical protein